MSPACPRLQALGAVFGEKSGWERLNWLEPNVTGAGVADPQALAALRPRGWAGQHWEQYAHTEFGAALWDTPWAAGAGHGLVAGGYRAIDALRLEKGYRAWGSDVTPEETPYESGPGFAVAMDKGDFTGRDALPRACDAGPRRRLRCLVLDDPCSVRLGNEPVRVDGEVVGRVTSGGYGWAVERSIVCAYLPPEAATIGTRGHVEVFGAWVGCEVTKEPLWDPDGTRVRA